MATSPTLLSIDEYLRTGYHPDADYVDGEIEERNLGEYEHAKLQQLIGRLFGNSEDEWHVDVVIEQRIRVHTSRVRVCDVAVLQADAPHEHVTATPPLICIEIKSPEDRIPRVKKILLDYHLMGVPNIWFIDPIERTGFTFDGKELRATEGVFQVPDTSIRLDLPQLFADLDRKIAAHQHL